MLAHRPKDKLYHHHFNNKHLHNQSQKGASSDSSQTSALPLEASSTSSSMESLIYSLCAKRSHSVHVGFSRSCYHKTNVSRQSPTMAKPMFLLLISKYFMHLTNQKWVVSLEGHELIEIEQDIKNTS